MTENPGVARGPALENSRSYMGNIMSFLLRGEETSGRFSITEASGRMGAEPPPHVHLWENEIYYLLEGAADFFIEGRSDTLKADAGDVVFVPVGKAHAIYFRSEVFRTLIMAQATDDRSVGLDSFFWEMSKPTDGMSSFQGAETYAAGTPNDMEKAIATALRTGTQMLKPEETKAKLPNYPGFGAHLTK